ncbi:uncharacterized protein LOC131328874 isoform X2 [Rhododendron vialii]|uniref:uncharacterized protein LOC131328874 isoform X2 n=1 Tax=Rhododendron vialii TaxID=182163 RepID=UPI00265EFD42|nr:uncharacterized protein LOC131328874 isoform X2 [Rhododendron vialii]
MTKICSPATGSNLWVHFKMALRAPLDGGPCMLRSSFGDWEVAAMCFRNDSHRLVYKPSRSFVYDETCWFVKNIETNINAEFVIRFAY